MTTTTGLFSTGSGPIADAADIPTRMLVLGMARNDGTILATELYPVAEACGQTVDQVRSCLRRLVNEGLFERAGEGRDAVFTATDRGHENLGSTMQRARRAYVQDAAGKSWDRRWRLVAFAIPEARRSARDAFRDRLRDLGGAAVQPGLYVSPHRWHDDVRHESERLEVCEHVVLAASDDLEIGGVRDPRQLAAQLWPLDELAARYEHFTELYETVPANLEAMRDEKRKLTDAEFLPGALIIGLKFQECFDRDPLLPPELLPRPWPGRSARDLLARCRRLGVRLRAERDRPQPFAAFDDLLGDLA